MEAFYKCKFGILKIRYDNDYITEIKIVKQLGKSIKSDLSDIAYNQISEYFNGQREEFNLPFKLIGSEFCLKVWGEVLKIPYGHLCTYKQIAQRIGNQKAARAVGMANKNNPIMFVVPCHRVIGSSGKLTGYSGGLELKKALLDMEKIIVQE